MLGNLLDDVQVHLSKGRMVWQMRVPRLKSLMQTLLRSSGPSESSSRQQVASSVLDLWEAIRADTATHDLTIRCAESTVTAHSHVVAKASPVVSAMLSSGMQEAAKKEVCVDCSSGSVSFLLDLLYTGSSCQEISAEIGLSALDLAHRWQLNDTDSMLERALIGMLSADNFVEVAEAALLKDLGQMKAACRRFATENKEVLQMSLPDVVAAWLHDKPSDQRKSKKQRVMY
mmetsp:Transcript_19860/g.46183  ORF Transcript_19860/g.46183 Transcript_19860/m.46183 type:complete len:230 (+) Transcript_19860:424-1113(+)